MHNLVPAFITTKFLRENRQGQFPAVVLFVLTLVVVVVGPKNVLAEVQALLGAFCASDRGTVSDALVLVGMTWDGTEVYSVPVGNAGVDQLVKKN